MSERSVMRKVLRRGAILILVFLCYCQSEHEPCLLFFTVQPPLSVPCNPHCTRPDTNDATLALQCTVHAPRLHMDLQQRNFTLEWVRQAYDTESGHTTGAAEEIISVASSRTGLKVENEHVSYFYGSESEVGVYVKSVLSFDLTRFPPINISGKYWCRVLEKTLDNYTYSVAGRSDTETLITDSWGRSTLFPPCVGEAAYSQAGFKCVHDRNSDTAPDSRSSSESFEVWVSSRVVVGVMAVTGGVTIVVLVMRLTCRPTTKKKECERSPHLKQTEAFHYGRL